MSDQESLYGDSDSEDRVSDRTGIYHHYKFNTYSEAAQSLPVQSWKAEILQNISLFQVAVVEGATGSGKSTQVPQFILDDAVKRMENVNIVVTQPRKIAAITLAQRVCEERGWHVGNLVGYQVGLDPIVSPDTRLSFVTTEVLVQKLIHGRSLDEFTHIILDEVHERDHHTDFLLLLIKKMLDASPQVKIILMSATIDSDKFRQYFSVSVRGLSVPCPTTIVSQDTVYPIHISYLDCLPKEQQVYHSKDLGLHFNTDLAEVCRDIIISFDKSETRNRDTEISRGAVLVFLPGLQQIEYLMDVLEENMTEMKWSLYPLHSSLPGAQQRAIFQPALSGYRKIIVSTNLAESSITVNDCDFVIDFCLTKTIMCDPLTHYTSLVMDWASKANCKQRAGRTGRVRPGKVFRLVPQHFYNGFADYTQPELLRIPLSSAILKVKRLDMGTPEELLSLALDAPKIADIKSTILILKQIGALSLNSEQSDPYDGELTYLGKIASLLPLDPKFSKLIVMSTLFGCSRDAIVIAAGLSLQNLFVRQYQQDLECHMNKVSMAHGSASDCVAIVNAYELWQQNRTGGYRDKEGRRDRPGGRREQQWAHTNNLQLSVLQDMEKLIDELNSRLSHKGFKVEAKNVKNTMYTLKLKMCIASAFYPHYYTDCLVKCEQENWQKDILDFDPYNMVRFEQLPAFRPEAYEQDIQTLLGRYLRNFKVYIHERRAYVILNQTNNNSQRNEIVDDGFQFSGRILNLIMALKLRMIPRIRSELYLNVKPYEELQVSHANGKGFDLGFVSSEARFGSVSVIPGPSVKLWKIIPRYVVDATTFFAIESKHLATSDHLDTSLRNLEKDLSPVDSIDVTLGFSCLAPYYQTMYRAILVDVRQSTGKVVVFFVDYGNTEEVRIDELRQMPSSMKGIPKLAVQCTLTGIMKSQGIPQWPRHVTEITRKALLHENESIDTEIFSVMHDVVSLTVKLPPGRLAESLEKTLLDTGAAVPKEEVHLSQESNRKREQFLKSVKESIVKEKHHTKGSRAGQQNKKTLVGPLSPLVSTLTSFASWRGIEIDTTSVNSPLIDVLPYSTVPQFVVAALVSTREGAAKAHCTTLMPRNLGLTQLTAMLFSPQVELRASGGCYYEIFAGLGSYPHKTTPLLPNSDMTIPINFEFDHSHLTLVNHMRQEMNFALFKLKQDSNFDLTNVQKNLHDKLVK